MKDIQKQQMAEELLQWIEIAGNTAFHTKATSIF